MVGGAFWGLPGEDPSRLLWSGWHPERISLIRGDWQGEEQDCFLAIVSPRATFAASVLLEANKPILLCVLLGYVGVVMVFLQPFQEQAFLTCRLRAVQEPGGVHSQVLAGLRALYIHLPHAFRTELQLNVLVAPVPCPIHCAIWKDPQEVAPVAAVEQFGLLVIPWRQIKLLSQGCEGCDFSFSHGSQRLIVVLSGPKSVEADAVPEETASTWCPELCHCLVTVTLLWLLPRQPGAGSLNLWVPAAHLAWALGRLPSAQGQLLQPSQYYPEAVGWLRRKGVPIHHQKGVSVEKRGDALVPPEAVGFSRPPFLGWVGPKQQSETPHTQPAAGGFLALRSWAGRWRAGW